VAIIRTWLHRWKGLLIKMKKIQQQLYTRGRSGVFSSGPGYDTVAKSPGVENTFIKKVLHPLCSYYPPKALASTGEKDERKFPKSFLVSFLESGELLLGQSVHKETDYTGERETFFSHNYIIPAERASEFALLPEKLFGDISFITTHDVAEQGKALDELDEIPIVEKNEHPPLITLLERASLTAENFKQLLYAHLYSLVSKKKVFVTIKGDVTEASYLAKNIAYYLFHATPPEMRKYYGFSSYQAEPQSKKNMSLIFVEKGSIRTTDSNFSKDFIFDFATGKTNVNENIEGHPYVDFAYENLINFGVVQSSFFNFTSNALMDMHKVSLLLFNDLTQLYKIKEGDFSLYEENKSRTFLQFLSFIKPETITKKLALYELLVDLVQYENQQVSKQLPTSNLTFQMADLYPYLKNEDLSILANFFVKVFYYGHEDIQFLVINFEKLQTQMPLFKIVMSRLAQEEKIKTQTLYPYVEYRMNQVNKLNEAIKEVVFYMNQLPQLFLDNQMYGWIADGIVRTSQKEKDTIQAYQLIKKEFAKASTPNLQIEHFKKQIVGIIGTLVISSLNMSSITAEQFQQAAAIIKNVPEERQKGDIFKKVSIIEAVNDVVESRRFKEAQAERYYKSPNLNEIQNLVLKLIDIHNLRENAGKIAFAFYNGETTVGPVYRYVELINFIHKQKGITGVKEFLEEFPYFSRNAEKTNVLYTKMIRNYLLENYEEIKKDKRLFRKLEKAQDVVLRKIMKEVIVEKQNPILRFFDKHGKIIAIMVVSFSLILFLLGGVTVLFLDKFYKTEPTKADINKDSEGKPNKTNTEDKDKKTDDDKTETLKENIQPGNVNENPNEGTIDTTSETTNDTD
jgi:GTPase-associated protein 1, N-terminal domain type 2/GTPase-associated protein 1, middle domain